MNINISKADGLGIGCTAIVPGINTDVKTTSIFNTLHNAALYQVGSIACHAAGEICNLGRAGEEGIGIIIYLATHTGTACTCNVH